MRGDTNRQSISLNPNHPGSFRKAKPMFALQSSSLYDTHVSTHKLKEDSLAPKHHFELVASIIHFCFISCWEKRVKLRFSSWIAIVGTNRVFSTAPFISPRKGPVPPPPNPLMGVEKVAFVIIMQDEIIVMALKCETAIVTALLKPSLEF